MPTSVFVGVIRSRQARVVRETSDQKPPPTSAATPPKDCVREFPTLNPETVELVAFDWEGQPRYRSEVPREEDLTSWHTLLLRRCRRMYPPRRLELMG
jgi:hypothetical protein